MSDLIEVFPVTLGDMSIGTWAKDVYDYPTTYVAKCAKHLGLIADLGEVRSEADAVAIGLRHVAECHPEEAR